MKTPRLPEIMLPQRRNWRRFAVHLLLWIACASPLPGAGSQQYLHRAWQVEDGLFDPVSRAVIQSRDGYLWIGTDGGLVRFDGARFTEFETRRPSDFHDRWIVALMEASDGSIWTSSVNGGILRIKDGERIRYTKEDGLPHDHVMALLEDRAGVIWIGTAAGLARYRNGGFDTYGEQPVRSIVEDRKGNLWIGTGRGLSRIQGGDLATYTNEENFGVHSVVALHIDRDENLWIGTSDEVVFYNSAEETFHHYPMKEGLAHGVRAIHQDKSGNIWIGSHAGLQQLEDGEFIDVVLDEGKSGDGAGPIPDFVYAIYEDREDNLWVGTNYGLNQLRLPKFKTYSTEEGLPHQLTTSVYEDRAGRLWIGTWGGGLARLSDGGVETWTERDGLSSDFVLGILEDSAGNLWIGTDGEGLNLFTPNGAFEYYRLPASPGGDVLAANTIRVVFEDGRGQLWIGTNGELYQFANGEFRTLSELAGEEIKMVKTIVEDGDGTLWVGSRDGLTRIDGNQAVTYGRESGISGLPVNTIFPDRNGLWISTDAGGLEWFEGGQVTTRLTEPARLLREKFLHILDDRAGFLWMSSRSGIFRIRRQELSEFLAGRSTRITPITYGQADGMRRSQCNGIAQPAGWTDSRGRIWFPTMSGAVSFDPAATPINKIPPTVAVESMEANKEPVPLTDGVRVRPGSRNLHFRYTAPSLNAAQQVRFRYQLVGFDEDFQEGGSAREVSYNNLRPGDYTFRVIASNSDGIWNETGASLSFTLPRQFYETYWFLGLCGIGLIFTGAGVFRVRLSRMRARERELTALIEERTWKLKAEILDREEAERRTAILSKLGQKLSLASTLEEAAEVIFEAADKLIGWDAGFLYAMGEKPDDVHPIIGYDVIDGRRQAVAPDSEQNRLSPAAQHAIREGGQLILRRDPSGESCGHHRIGDKSRPSASLMHVPVRKGAETVGLLSIQSYTPDAFSKRDLETLQMLVDYCAGAMDRIRAERALNESQQMVLRQERLAVVGQLAAGVAHEFNNILTVVKGHTMLALDEPTLAKEVVEMLSEVSQGTDRAAELTRQLLAFSRKQAMQAVAIDLNALIEKLSGVLMRLLGENIFIDLHLQKELPSLQADPGMMEQIVMNLALNARDAMPTGGRLTLSTRRIKVERDLAHPEARRGNFICLEIADTGVGMDEATASRIFEPFFSTKDVGKGSGLGLSSVYGIVKQHKGWIEVTSGVGEGACFRVLLPV